MGQIPGMKCRIYFINTFKKIQLVSAEICPPCKEPVAAFGNFNKIVIFSRRLQLQ